MDTESPSRAGPAPSPGHSNNAGDAAREDEMIGSLGEALAGVSLAANAVHGNGFSFHTERQAGSPFNLGSQSNQNGREMAGWGFTPDHSSAKSGFNGNSTASDEPGSTRKVDPSTPNSARQTGNESLDLFLSQSPSQMFGGDVFKLSANGLAGLDMSNQDDQRSSDPFRKTPIGQSHGGSISASPGFGDIRQDSRRKTESPSSHVTGTASSSRSGSPYANADGSRTIHAYHGFDNSVGSDPSSMRNHSFVEADARSGSYGHGMPPMAASPGIPSPYSANNIMGGQHAFNGFATHYDVGSMHGSPEKQGMGGQQQVLYMAVPTPDGRGQVLQPVQMVQLPGKPFAYVLPGQGGMPGMQGGMQHIIPGMDPQQSPMMVMSNMPMQQQPQSPQTNDLIKSLVGGGGRNNQNRGMGYSTTPDSTQYSDSQPTMMRGDDYSSALGNGGQYNGLPGMTPPQAGQSDNISALFNGNQRPPLEALLGQVRRLSRDQVGCRLVQQALDEEGPMAATLILNEGLPFWGEALVDPFGNYLFQKILEKITPEERVMLVKSVSTRLVNASLNLHGTRSVQKIVELCAIDEENGEPKDKKDDESAADILTRSLAPAAARLCIDSHGNHVIQRILLKLGQRHSMFVFDAVAESVGDVARHRHGCCVIQRCLDSPPGPARAHLVRRIVDKSLELMQDAYGNYVVQYVLDVCSDDDVHAVCESVIGRVSLLAIQKFSSNVMEKCLERCTDNVKEHYMDELSDPDRIRELMMDPFGNYVVQRALSVATHEQAVRLVEAMRPHLIATQPGTPNGQRNGGVRNTAGGRRIMAKICRRFPNFTLNAGGTRDELYAQSKGHHRHQQQQHNTPTMAQSYSKPSTPRQQHAAHQSYNINNHPVNIPTLQYDQRHPYYEIGDTYFQHTPHMGNGAYQSGF